MGEMAFTSFSDLLPPNNPDSSLNMCFNSC
jgi:hypothetical protein